MALTPSLILVGLIAALLGITLLVSGLIGRRIGREPRCARCRFDLSGLHTPLETCPECGTSLARPRAVRTGLRRRGRVRLALAIPLLFLAAAAAGTGIWARLSNFNVNTIKPIPWLVADARRPGPAGQPALDELLRRAQAGTISTSAYTPIVRAGLRIQGDLSRQWEPKWGDLLLAAFTKGAMSAQNESRFLRQAFVPTPTTRPLVRQGDQLPLQVNAEIRLGSPPVPSSLTFGYSIMPLAATCEGDAAQMGWSTDAYGTLDQFGIPARKQRAGITMCRVVAPNDDNKWSLALARGAHTITAAIAYSVAISTQSGYPRYPKAVLPPHWATTDAPDPTLTDPNHPHAVTWIGRGEFDVEVVSPDAPDVTLRTDPSLGAQLKQTIKITRVNRNHSEKGWIDVGASISHDGTLPIAVAAEVFARAPDGREWYLGRAMMTPAQSHAGSHGWGTSNNTASTPGGAKPEDNTVAVEPLESFDAKTVSVILRPSPATARSTVDVNEIWGADLVFESVPVNDH